MSYVQRDLDVTIALGTGAFGEGGYNVVRLHGLRTAISVHNNGNDVSLNVAEIRVYGLSQSVMNEVTALGAPDYLSRHNVVTVNAGDRGGTMHLVFTGGIIHAWAVYAEAPDVSLGLSANTAILDKMKPIAPTSYQGATDVAVAMKGFADIMGVGFVNDGVDGYLLHSPYFPGTVWEQAAACAQAANISWYSTGQVLSIWPRNGFRAGDVVEIGPDSGLIGYPNYLGYSISLRCMFNPALRLGSRINLTTDIKPAAGIWRLSSVTHYLESETPGGAWFTELEAINFERKF